MEEKLIIDENKSSEYWLELNSEYKDYHVIAKWDGCVHFYRAYNGTDASDSQNQEEKDYIHICDIDEFIKMLQEVKEKAQKWYDNPEW
jgi:hypothetical protein